MLQEFGTMKLSEHPSVGQMCEPQCEQGIASPPPASFSNMPVHLQSLILAHAAAPLTTCQASAAIVKDQALLDTWVLQAAAAGTLKTPLQTAAEQGWWHLCSQLLPNMVFSRSDCQHSIALYHAAKAGQVELVQQLLSRGAWDMYPGMFPWLRTYTGISAAWAFHPASSGH
jgi:hypothetical protein